jgi:hypothetical protein
MTNPKGRKGAENPKDTRVTIRFTQAQYDRLTAIAEHDGLDVSPMIRSIVVRWLRDRDAKGDQE